MIIESAKAEIDRTKLARLLGGRSTNDFTHAVDRHMERWSGTRLRSLIEPRLMHTRVKLGAAGDRLQLENGLALQSVKAARIMEGCREGICFVATLGEGIDDEIRLLSERRRSAEAFILDAIGSVAVETVVETFQNRFARKQRAHGKTVTLRMSPGYCDWPLQEQAKLFSLLKADEIGVVLSDSCLMQPRKSIAGIFGLVPLASSRPLYNPCSECRKVDCKARRHSAPAAKTALQAS